MDAARAAPAGIEGVTLREIRDDDLPVLFEHQRDPVAARRAAFGSRDPDDRAAFLAHWAKIRADPSVVARAILLDGRLVGNVVCFGERGAREVGYWIGREDWGRGVASRALARFLEIVPERPLFAAVAGDNAASVRVLRRCGFAEVGVTRAFARARGEEVDELRFRLDAPPAGAERAPEPDRRG